MTNRKPRAQARMATAVMLATVTVVGAAEAGVDPPVPIEDPIEQKIPLSETKIGLQLVANGLRSPNWGTHNGVHANLLYATELEGQIVRIDLDTGATGVFLDVSDRLVNVTQFVGERGLLGLAFHPAYATNGLLYTYTSEPTTGTADFPVTGSDANHDSVVIEWKVTDPTDAASDADPASAREILRIEEPQGNHNGGALVFGPDDLLYIALGDGGNADDAGPGHSQGGNAQDTGNPLGAILRIDVDARTSTNGQYGIPASNPDLGVGAVAEIYAYGFRNPFRISFDGSDLYVADVGQGDIEEVDLVVAGGNYGWPWREGSFFFDGNGDEDSFVFLEPPPTGGPENLVDPIAEYDHDEGIAIIGGFVSHGAGLPELEGTYVFGEYGGFAPARFFAIDDGSAAGSVTELEVTSSPVAPTLFGPTLFGFGQDMAGEVYALMNDGCNNPLVILCDTGFVARLPEPSAGLLQISAALALAFSARRRHAPR